MERCGVDQGEEVYCQILVRRTVREQRQTAVHAFRPPHPVSHDLILWNDPKGGAQS
jgi:hypothetical protein